MYATLADILEQMAEADLIALTDDQDLGEVDETAVDRAIANAMTMIDGHCGDRYAVPFDPVPDLVRMYAVDLAVYNLYSRRTHVAMPEVIADRQKQALAYLRQVQKGEAGIGVTPLAAGGGDSNSALIPGNERLFTREKMRGL